MISTIKPVKSDFAVFAGFEDHLFSTLSLGGDGAISTGMNVAPNLSVNLYKAFQAGEYEISLKFHKKLVKILLLYQLDTPFMNVMKEAIKLRGIDISTYVQPPAQLIEKTKRKQIRNILQQVEILD